MEILSTIEQVKRRLRPVQAQGLRVGFVPTMGALHRGHLSLVHVARERSEVVVASVFVNPKQFGPTEDLNRYPRDLAADAEMLAEAGCDVLFAPLVEEIYPGTFETTVELARTPCGLCGDVRPGHFRGVTTVVMKLFGIVRPDVAVFGEKDFQQLAVIRRMAADLALDVEVVGAPLVRDADGLALSSRNAYLSLEDRARARAISMGLGRAAAAYDGGERDARRILGVVLEALAGVDIVPEYLELRSLDDLTPLSRAERPCVVLVAARVGATRLLDNWILARS